MRSSLVFPFNSGRFSLEKDALGHDESSNERKSRPIHHNSEFFSVGGDTTMLSRGVSRPAGLVLVETCFHTASAVSC